MPSHMKLRIITGTARRADRSLEYVATAAPVTATVETLTAGIIILVGILRSEESCFRISVVKAQ